MSERSRYFDLVDYILEMKDRGWLKQDVKNLIKEAYFFTHGEEKEDDET